MSHRRGLGRIVPPSITRHPWAVAWGMTVATLAALFWPSDQLPGWTMLSWDKLLHAGLFFALTVAWLRTGLSIGRVGALMVALVLVSEVGQSLLPIGRYGDPFDGLADLVGIALALKLPALGRGRGAGPESPDPDSAH